MGHRAYGREVVLLGEVDVGGSNKFRCAKFVGEGSHDIILPVAAETTTGAKVGETEPRIVLGYLDLGVESLLRHAHVHEYVLEVDLIHDGKNGDFEKHGEEPVALGHDGKLAALEVGRDVLAVEHEVHEEVGIVAFDESDGPEVVDLVRVEADGAEMVDFLVDSGEHGGREDCPIPALELVADVGRRELVQDGLLHGKFIHVVI